VSLSSRVLSANHRVITETEDDNTRLTDEMSESQIGNVLPATAGQIVVTPGTQLTSSEAEGTSIER